MRKFYLYNVEVLALLLLLSLGLMACSEPSTHGNTKAENSVDQQIQTMTNKLKASTDDQYLTRHILERTLDQDIENIIQENIYVNFNVNEESTKKDFKIAFEKLTAPQQVVYSSIILEKNVEAIGFQGYFKAFNSAGQFAIDAKKAYTILKAPVLGDIVGDAVDRVNDDLKPVNNQLQKLDTIFLQRIKTENINARRIRYIRENIDSFINR